MTMNRICTDFQSQTIMTMTRTRRKQKQEMARRAVKETEERQSILRQEFPLRAASLIQMAAYEPALFHHAQEGEGHAYIIFKF